MVRIQLLSEKEILAKINSQKTLYSPLEIVSVEGQPAVTSRYQPDAKITVAWQGRKTTFLAEVKARTAPKIVAESLWHIKRESSRGRRNFLLVVPYLSKTIIELLNQENLSGLDLNGNYLIQVPKMVAVRLDQKNRFPESQPIKRIFSGNSSMVARLMLVTGKRYQSVNQVHSDIRALGGSLSLSAVSKGLKGLEDEIVIERGARGILLLQPRKLLERLEEEYRPPKITGVMKLKLPGDGLDAVRTLNDLLPGPASWVLSGESSASRHAVMADTSVFKVYVTDFDPLADREDTRFFNVLAQKTSDSFPFFDAQEDSGLLWASPIQCCLELSKLGKREREAAATVRESIMGKLK